MTLDESVPSPKISVIMAAYNSERFIREAVTSVLAQTEPDFEFIIVNDGSSDCTRKILEEFARSDHRIICIHRDTPSGGPTIPKNLGLLAARGKYICFLDHDDCIHPEKIELLSRGLDENPMWGAIFSDLQVIDELGVATGDTYLRSACFHAALPGIGKSLSKDYWDLGREFYKFMSLRYAGMHTNSVMLALDRLKDDPPYFRKLFGYVDDTDLWLRVGAQTSIGYIDRVLAFHRTHKTNLSADSLAMMEYGLLVHHFNRTLFTNRFSEGDLSAYCRKIAETHITCAYRYRSLGDMDRCIYHYRMAFLNGQPGHAAKGLARAFLHKFFTLAS